MRDGYVSFDEAWTTVYVNHYDAYFIDPVMAQQARPVAYYSPHSDLNEAASQPDETCVVAPRDG